MKTFWLFRTNLRKYEYYHSIDNLEQFKNECHDFYLLMGIWMLENTELQEFVVWRLVKEQPKDAIYSGRKEFIVNGKPFVQLFVNNFEDCFSFPSPDITFFRGGFPEYAKLTKAHSKHFGLKLYYGAGRRIQPQYGGVYDKILVEDKRDYGPDTIPFYKTANPNIFYPMNLERKWDICWPCNFAQLKYKGQEWFIKQIAKSDYLRTLKILHIGDKPGVGKKLCDTYRVNNIEFKGWVTRPELNKYLNQSKIGLVTSNELDGSPRIITEIIMSGRELMMPETVKHICVGRGYYDYNIDTLESIMDGFKHISVNYDFFLESIYPARITGCTMRDVCQKNLEMWK